MSDLVKQIDKEENKPAVLDPTAVVDKYGTIDPRFAMEVAAFLPPGVPDHRRNQLIVKCARMGLSPMLKQVYVVPMKNGTDFQDMISIEGVRIVARRNPDFDGCQGPFFWSKDQQWHEVWPSKEAPIAAKFIVHHKSISRPTEHILMFDEYRQNTPIWRDKPCTMLGKCVEAACYRKAFPNDLQGSYIREEMPDVMDADFTVAFKGPQDEAYEATNSQKQMAMRAFEALGIEDAEVMKEVMKRLSGKPMKNLTEIANQVLEEQKDGEI